MAFSNRHSAAPSSAVGCILLPWAYFLPPFPQKKEKEFQEVFFSGNVILVSMIKKKK